MTVLRVYSRAEEAYLDAAYLGALGVETTVVDERGYGGNLLAAVTSAIRLEVDDDRAEAARQLLHEQIKEPVALAVPANRAPADSLPTFFRAILVYDILSYLARMNVSHPFHASRQLPDNWHFVQNRAFTSAAGSAVSITALQDGTLSLRRGMRPEERLCLPQSQNTNDFGARFVVEKLPRRYDTLRKSPEPHASTPAKAGVRKKTPCR